MKIWSLHLLDSLSNWLMNLKNSGDSTGFYPMTSATPASARVMSSFDFKHRTSYNISLTYHHSVKIVAIRHNYSIHLHLLHWFKIRWFFLDFFCSHASKLKITFSLCVTPDRRRYDRPLHLSNGAAFSSTALFVMVLYSSCWIIQLRFSIDPSKTNFPRMFNNSMQQRCSIAPPRFSILQCLYWHPQRYKLVLHVCLEMISIFLYFY